VPWEWAQRVLKRADDLIEPLHVCQLAQAADIVEFADAGRTLRFTHQLLQEYFAAVALESKLGFLQWPHIRETYRWHQQTSHWQQRIRGYIAAGTRTGWEETLFMLAGLRENAAYLQELTAQFLSRPLEAAQIVSGGDIDEALRGEVIGAALKQLEDRALTVQQRLDAGAALAMLADPRAGVVTLEPQWCDVPAGPLLLGSSDTDREASDWEKPQRTVDLPGFQIGRYPVTNAQWRMFVEAGGYRAWRWWSYVGWQTKEAKSWIQPDVWDDPRFNGANQPVVGISWYEATAFCRWLTAQLGYEIRLPCEAEWEKAARGSDGRIYPWGNDWDTEKANTNEAGIGITTPVGCFPDGASPYDVLDICGNVFEWTATPWTSDYQHSDGTTRETEDGRAFAWRGGAWNDVRRHARCAYRDYLSPADRYDFLGVRVVAALTLAE
jgi:formylglycine-generating enzyme required for sulfatase activity